MRDPLVLSDADMIIRRPHFRRTGDQLFFLASSRATRYLSKAECALWDALDRPRSLAELASSFTATEAIVADWHRAQICERIEGGLAAGRRPILVVEPHADDAALSVGGTLWQRRRECEFTIATMASRSNFTSYYYLDRDYFSVADVVAIRDAESALFARSVGGNWLGLGLRDAVLRYHDGDWSLDFYRRHKGGIAAATARDAPPEVRAEWVAAARALLARREFAEVWIPQGSPHADHRLTAESFLAAAIAEPELLAGRTLRMYRDVPYAARYPQYGAGVDAAMQAAGIVLAPEPVPITGALGAKLRLISLYASQFKIGAMRSDVAASARLAGAGGDPAELVWAVRDLPAAVPDLRGGADRAGEAESAAWLRRIRGGKALRILLLTPTGCWHADIARIRRVIPGASIEVFAAPAALAEVEGTPAVRIEQVPAGPRAWGVLALRLAVAAPMPTLFLAGERRNHARALARLWPLSPTLVVESFNPVARALDAHAARPERLAA